MPPLLGTAVQCFRACTAPPVEYVEYFNFLPLYRNPEELFWGEEEYAEEEEGVEERAVPVPKRSEIEERFLKESGGASTIPPEKATKIAHEMGFAPSRVDETALAQHKGGITVSDFDSWLKSIQHPEDTPEYLKKFFQKFDTTGEGRLTRRQISVIFTSHGGADKLTSAEVQALLTKVGRSKDANVPYEELCKEVLTPA